MPSTQLQTTTQAATITHGRVLVLASARLYAILNDGTNLVYQYSDDDGVSWSSEVTIIAGADFRASAFYDSVNTRLNICYAGGNIATTKLAMRAITTNVTSGVPGALTTETVIDAGGANAGIQYPYALRTSTGTNPRYWIIAKKWTSATVSETRAWYAPQGVSADTAGNWVTTNFTNLGGNSDTNANKLGIGEWWGVGGLDKLTFVFADGSTPEFYEAVTFDPTAATPTPGTVTSSLFTFASGGAPDPNANGALITLLCPDSDYLVFGRFDASDNTWDFFKSVDGVTWASPTGWSSLTMGRCQMAGDGTDLYLVHTESYGVLATSAQPLKYRKITLASDNMGGITAFSDQNGNGVAVPQEIATTKLYALYRGSTTSPYTVRSDFVNLSGGGDVTPPGQAGVTVGTVTDTTAPLSLVMPTDIDVEQLEVRYLTGTTAPAPGRTNGTVSLVPTVTSANATVAHTITGLTAGVQITGRVFVKDTAGNWNTGQSFTATPVTLPAFVSRYKIDGTTVVADGLTPGADIFVWQLSTSNFLTGGANAHAELRVGSQSGTPPTGGTYDILSTAGTSVWQYENAALVWTNWPTAGLPSTDWARRIRCNVDTNQSSQFGSLRVKNG